LPHPLKIKLSSKKNKKSKKDSLHDFESSKKLLEILLPPDIQNELKELKSRVNKTTSSEQQSEQHTELIMKDIYKEFSGKPRDKQAIRNLAHYYHTGKAGGRFYHGAYYLFSKVASLQRAKHFLSVYAKPEDLHKNLLITNVPELEHLRRKEPSNSILGMIVVKKKLSVNLARLNVILSTKLASFSLNWLIIAIVLNSKTINAHFTMKLKTNNQKISFTPFFFLNLKKKID